jgi:acyl carrier protein phosphodiesterase
MDHHPISIEGIKRLRPDFHKYSTVIIDILYDHFLARNWNKFHQLPLHEFVQRQYKFLHEYQSIMPEMPKRMLAYMSKQNWLESYIEIKGIIQALEGMSRRIKHDYQLDNAVEIMLRHYDDYENEVLEFIPQILLKSEEWLKEINALKS